MLPSRVAFFSDVRVTHKYRAVAPDELNIVPGDVIKDCKSVPGEAGWMTGTLNGVTGLFPDNFVKVSLSFKKILQYLSKGPHFRF